MNTFTDVKEGDWFYDPIFWAGKNGIVSGTQFNPTDPTNRGQALTFLWRAAGKPAPNLKVSPYADVKEDDYFYQPVLWGFENGLISTAEDGKFHADGTLTRAQAVTFLFRAVDGKPSGSQRSFADVTPDNWYFDPANWALENGIVGRGDDWSFHPDDTMTRAEFVTLLYRAYDPDARKADPNPPNRYSFDAMGIPGDVDDHGSKVLHTLATNRNDDTKEPVTFTTEVADYRVFEEDDAFPKVDGYEYRVMTVHLVAKNAEDHARLYQIRTVDSDYYNAALYDDSWDEDEDGLQLHTIIYNGVPMECTIWDRSDYESRDGYFHLDWTWTASVPKGYDGLVVGFRTSALDDLIGDLYTIEYLTSEENFVLYRMN